MTIDADLTVANQDTSETQPLGLKWWYASAILSLTLGNAIVLMQFWKSSPETAIFLAIVNSYLSVLVLRHNKYAFLIHVILSLNPFWWIVNGIYLKNRWRHPKLNKNSPVAINASYDQDKGSSINFRSTFRKYRPDMEYEGNYLQDKAVDFVNFIMGKMLANVKDVNNLEENEILSIFLVGFIVSDYISNSLCDAYPNTNHHEISFELISLIACSAFGVKLFHNKDLSRAEIEQKGEHIGALVQETGAIHNDLFDQSHGRKILMTIGNGIDKFFHTNDVHYIKKITLFHKGLISLIKSSGT